MDSKDLYDDTSHSVRSFSEADKPSLRNSGSCVPLPGELDIKGPVAADAVEAATIAAAAVLPVCGQMAPENDGAGNVEYKRMLVDPDESRFQHLVTQMRWRLCEGSGEAVYEVGVDDDGTPTGLDEEQMKKTLQTLERMAEQNGASIKVLRHAQGLDGMVAEVLVRLRNESGEVDSCSEVRVATVGNVDSGKSTLMSILTHGGLDDGRGSARVKVMRCEHEIKSGKTSSISHHSLLFNSSGDILNYTDDTKTETIHKDMDLALFSLDVDDAAAPIKDANPSKVVHFVDLAGHEKYLKTTLFGMTATRPDYCMMTIGGNMGLVGMTKEHLGLAMALRIPVFFAITKVDMCPSHVLKDTIAQLKRILKTPGCKMVPYVVRTEEDVLDCSRKFVSQRIAPIFPISCVTGHGLALLRSFINLLPVPSQWSSAVDKPLQFDIDADWSVPGVGTVVSGTVIQGVLENNSTVLLGPDGTGQFTPVTIRSVYGNLGPVSRVSAGGSASVALRKVPRTQIRKGMVLAAPELKPVACKEFTAEILVLYHNTTIQRGYSAVMHCNNVRQTVNLCSMDKELLRSGDKALVKFRFDSHPEFLVPGSRMIFREGRAKGIGRVVSVEPYVPDVRPKKGKPAGHSKTRRNGKR